MEQWVVLYSSYADDKSGNETVVAVSNQSDWSITISDLVSGNLYNVTIYSIVSGMISSYLQLNASTSKL